MTIMGRAYDEGRTAFLAGAEYHDNPYAAPSGGHQQFAAWQAGWTHEYQLHKKESAS